MSHKSKICLVMQAKGLLDGLVCFGRSKHLDKTEAAKEWEQSDKTVPMWEYINNAIRAKIYSITTYKNYAKHINYFIEWVETNHPYKERKTIAQIRRYVPEWLEYRKQQNLSAYTLKLEAAALAKLYQCPTSDFGVDLPQRKRENITRSRGHAVRDDSFSLARNEEIINFCRGTGLRRSELKTLRGTQLIEKPDGTYYLSIIGKGGRHREAPIVGPHTEEIVARVRNAGDGLVWPSVPSHMDVHSYRAEYCTYIYKTYERKKIPKGDLYICRGSRKGEKLDKKAMLIASQALGHNRINVIASHYIR